jgi:kynurenine formamidase
VALSPETAVPLPVLDPLLAAVAGGVVVHDLARPMQPGMAQSPNHPEYRHTLPRRHGDAVRADGGSAANDLLVLGTHVGTHVDALCHVSHDGLLFGGHSAAEAQVGGRFTVHGAETIPPTLCRGVLLDVAALHGRDVLEPGYEITPADLQDAALRQGTAVRPGDAVLVRSGWGAHWDDRTAYLGHESGVPGVGEDGARQLAAWQPSFVGADTIAFERLAPGAGHALLPAHRVLLVEHGISIVETMQLDGLSALGVFEFLFVLAPLPLVGATGSPVRPLAVVARG